MQCSRFSYEITANQRRIVVIRVVLSFKLTCPRLSLRFRSERTTFAQTLASDLRLPA